MTEKTHIMLDVLFELFISIIQYYSVAIFKQ